MNDVRYALRQLAKNPGFTLIAVATLALGLGGTTAIFTLINSILLKPLPFDEPGQLALVWETPELGKINSVSPGAFLDIRNECKSFESVSLVHSVDLNLTGVGEPERLRGIELSGAGLQILRARPALGRIFTAEEEAPGREKVVVLTHDFWRTHFGSDPAAVGRTIRLNDDLFQIIGVLPPKELPWSNAQFFIPKTLEPWGVGERTTHWIGVMGRLRPGVTLEQSQAELTALRARLSPLYPQWKKDWGFKIQPLKEQMVGDVRPLLWLLFSAVGCVLMIACANVANLLLAKGAARKKEITIRLALGAGRRRIAQQLLTESAVLAIAGAAAGILVALWITSLFAQITAVDIPRGGEIALDWRALAFTGLTAGFAAIGFGLMPAFQAAGTDLNESLKEGARGSDHRGGKIRSTLIISEMALALLLLVGAGLLLNSFYRRAHVAPGFETQNVLTMQLSLPGGKYPDGKSRAAFYARVLEKLKTIPGVQDAAFASSIPLARWPGMISFAVIGRANEPVGGHPVDFDFCSADYFRVMQIPLLQGSVFSPRDDIAARRAVVISQELARKHFPNSNPIGQQLNLEAWAATNSGPWEIIGVVGDVRRRGLDGPLETGVYRPTEFAWDQDGYLILKTKTAPMAFAETVRKAVLEIDPSQPVAKISTLDDILAKSLAQHRVILIFLGAFAAVALALAAIGLYGVIAYAVSLRTREIGIRMALGADAANVIQMILRQGLNMATLGIAIGLIASIALTRLMTQLLYGVQPTDPLTLAAVSILLVAVAISATLIPARRASKIEPTIALRAD